MQPVKVQRWQSTPPSQCDVCKAPITKSFSDARLPMLGSWGIVCPACFMSYGCKTGTGHGQTYVKHADGSWPKVAG